MVVTINKKQLRTNTERAVVPASGVIVSTPFHCVNYVARPTDVRVAIQTICCDDASQKSTITLMYR